MAGSRPRAVVISASFGAGHDGAAAELTRRLHLLGCTVDRHDFVDLMPRRAGVVLRGLYRRQLTTVPQSWGWLLSLAGTDHVAGPSARLTALADDATLQAIGTGADLIVSTYPLASQVLGRLRLAGRLAVPVVTYLTDLSVHRLWVSAGVDVHLALHDEPARQAKEHGARDVRVVAPAVSPAFGEQYPGYAARERWGLPAAEPLALLVGGAWGVGSVARAAADVAATGLAVPVVACGRNDTLRHKLRRAGHAVALDWVDDMAALMHSCQVVVQNAGGLSALEALSAGVPVVTYRNLPGHGRTNADSLDRAGWVPWIRDRGDLACGLRAAMSAPSGFAPAAAQPETVLAELAVMRRAGHGFATDRLCCGPDSAAGRRTLGDMTQFTTTFRGYDRAEVDSFVEKTTDALASDDPKRRAKAAADAMAVTFHTAWRGYDRESVDHYLRRIARGRPDDRT